MSICLLQLQEASHWELNTIPIVILALVGSLGSFGLDLKAATMDMIRVH